MSVSKLLPAGGNNDFNISITAVYSSSLFTKEYSAGSYTIASALGDTTFDVYVFNSDGSSAGYTKTPSLSATKGFNKIVIIGGTVGDLLTFSYKTTYTTADDSDEVTAGPVLTSISPSKMANVDDTITITGRNFASDIGIAFTNTGYSSTAAKNVVRSSATSLIVTRPDTFPAATAGYTITATNPGVTAPTGTDSHILLNAVSAGTGPSWTTGATLPVYTKSVAYSQAVVATDSPDSGSTITYSVVSSTLPAGITFATTSGTFAGTATTSTVNGTATIRATDAGGNYIDRTFTINNVAPTWTTTAGALPTATQSSSYTTTVAATDDGTSVAYSVATGSSLPAGLSINSSSGVISGTPTTYTGFSSPASFAIRATDDAGNYTDRTFTIAVVAVQFATLNSSQTWTVPTGVTSIDYIVVAGGGAGSSPGSNVGASGGGAGGMIIVSNASVTPGAGLAAVVGNGGQGSNTQGDSGYGYQGGGSSFNGTSCSGGGGGGAYNSAGGNLNGGSGGGAEGNASSTPGTGISGQGNNGGTRSGQYDFGSGGGKSGAGSDEGAGGAGYTWVDGITYAQGGAGNGSGGQGGINAYADYANRGYGGTGKSGTQGSSQWGASGRVKIRYLA
jgi:hypothetical protein